MEVKHRQTKGTQLKDLIIRQLYFERSLSCAELGVMFSRSAPVITQNINELIKEGFVTEVGYASSSGGRRPLKYALKADAMYVMAIAMDQLSTRIAILDLNNNPVAGVEMMELFLNGNPNALVQLIEYINTYFIKTGIERSRVLGIGVGMPGFVSVTKGVNYSYLDTGGPSLTEYLFEATGLPTYYR